MNPENDQERENLIKQAKKVLDKNWKGNFTIPAEGAYPHQWSWDSAFMAFGYSHYAQEKAEKELSRLFTGQWNNGMVPHIVYNESDEDTSYFPGPDFWETENVSQAPDEPKTSGICQPPLHATAVRYLLENAEDRDRAQGFTADLFPKLKAWHNFLYDVRDPDDEGLAYILHPWASGQDNAPNWDTVLNRIDLKDKDIPDYERQDQNGNSSERPSDKKYDLYVYLIGFFRRHNYDQKKIREADCPFMVQDVMFNTLLCRAGQDMAQIAAWLGEDPAPFQKQSRKTAKAINEKLWDENHGIYIDYDLHADKPIPVHMLSGFIPYFADIPSPVRAKRMFNYLNTSSFSKLDESHLAVPSYDRQEPKYSSKKYWRGPIWLNLNWLLYKGLARYSYQPYDQKIKNTIIKLCKEQGFHEYYNPGSGKGEGADDFGWSAALLIDILESEKENIVE
jgi:hypothetical protein